MVNFSNGKAFFAMNLLNSNIIGYFLLLIFIFQVIYKIKKKEFNAIKMITLFIFYIYIFGLVSVTLFPISLFGGNDPIYSYGFGKQHDISLDILGFIQNGYFQNIGNTILLAPLVYFIAILEEKFSKLKMAFLLAFFTSLSIETLQLIMSYFYLGNRIFDIDDILFNTFGGVVLGLLLYQITNWLFSNQIKLARKK